MRASCNSGPAAPAILRCAALRPRDEDLLTELALRGSQGDEAALRPIHYLGNKSKILADIAGAIADMAPAGEAVCDLFAGTGVVSRELAKKHAVYASDVQEYSRVLTAALLFPRALPTTLHEATLAAGSRHSALLRRSPVDALLEYEQSALVDAHNGDAGKLCDIVESGALVTATSLAPTGSMLRVLCEAASYALPQSTGSVITRYYGGVYFGYDQAIALDGLAAAVRGLPHPYKNVGLAALLSTASDVVSSVGNHFAQPMKLRRPEGTPKESSVAAILRMRRRSVPQAFAMWLDRYGQLTPRPGNHRVRSGDFRSILASLPRDVGAIYADPPYTRDHYSRFYHVLETIAVGDEPGVSMMGSGAELRPSRAIYRRDRHQSPFSITSQVRAAFAAMFEATVRLDVPLVLSYSPRSPSTPSRRDTRLLSIEQLIEIAGSCGAQVSVRPTGRSPHSKLNRAHVNAQRGGEEAEVLLTVMP